MELFAIFEGQIAGNADSNALRRNPGKGGGRNESILELVYFEIELAHTS
jgi:hypothetical protein